MFDNKSDYALNKRSRSIIYPTADGSCIEIRPEDCPDFERWKAFSDENYHAQELDGRRVTRNNLPLDEDICGCADDPYEEKSMRTIESAMEILEQCLTETQRRRYLLYTRDGKTTRQIAQAEGVSQRTVMDTLQESERKIKIFCKNALSKR